MKTRASKRKRIAEEESKSTVEKSTDRIGTLPDDILNHMLSFLPFKSIAQTSVVSTRWRDLWHSYPVLDFQSPPTAEYRIKNVKLINRVVCRRPENSYIKLFRFQGSCSTLYLFDCITGLMEKHRVESLSLDVSLSDKFELPLCVYACVFLRSLTLKAYDPIDLPIKHRKDWFGFSSTNMKATSGLSSLHTLSLIRVGFSVDLFSGSLFPCLEKLTVGICEGMTHLNISCLGLKYVILFDMSVDSLDVSGMRLEELEVRSLSNKYSGSSVNILAPNLQTFSWYSNDIYEKCVIQSFPALRRSGISARPPWIFSLGTIHSTINLLRGSSQVRELVLSLRFSKILSDIYFQGGLPFSFGKLQALTICATLGKYDVPGIACLFKSSPIAHTLRIVIYDRRENDKWNNALLDDTQCTKEQYWKTQAQPLSPFLRHLKVVSIKVPSEMHEGVLDFARFLLEHGRALQKVKLYMFHDSHHRCLWEDKIGLLEGFPRASDDVKISVVEVAPSTGLLNVHTRTIY